MGDASVKEMSETTVLAPFWCEFRLSPGTLFCRQGFEFRRLEGRPFRAAGVWSGRVR